LKQELEKRIKTQEDNQTETNQNNIEGRNIHGTQFLTQEEGIKPLLTDQNSSSNLIVQTDV